MPGSIIRSTQLDGCRVARLVLACVRDPCRLQVACLTQACHPPPDGRRHPVVRVHVGLNALIVGPVSQCPIRANSGRGLLPRSTTGTARAARHSGPPHLDHSYVRQLQCFDPPDEAIPPTVPPAPDVLPPRQPAGPFLPTGMSALSRGDRLNRGHARLRRITRHYQLGSFSLKPASFSSNVNHKSIL